LNLSLFAFAIFVLPTRSARPDRAWAPAGKKDERSMEAKEMLRPLSQPGGGVTFLAVAAIAYGIACFLQGDFAIYWQPVPESVPLRQPLAYLSAGLLVLGGAGLLITRALRPAAMILLTLFALYDACYVLQLADPRTGPKALLGWCCR
jgi:uncharacterized membrane protein